MRRKLLLVLLLCLAFPALAMANALTNGGFETGNFSGWTVGGNASEGVAVDGTAISGTYYSDNVVNVHSGNYAAWAKVASANNVYMTLQQTVSVDADSTYDVGFWLSIGASNSAARSYEITVNGTKILDVQIGGNNYYDTWYGTDASNYLNENVQYTTGANETSVTVQFYFTGSGTALVGFSYDDFYFEKVQEDDPPVSSVPEPVSMLLLGLGLLGIAGIGKSKKK